MQVAKDVYVLPLTNEQGTVYVSLLTGGGHTVLVDTGYPGEFSQLQDALKSEGFSVSDLTDVLLTHHDIDHIGCLKDLVEANPLIRIVASKYEIPYLEGRAEPEKVAKMRRDLGSLSAEGEQFFKQFEQAFKNRLVVVDEEVVTRKTLPYAGGVEVIGTPGHTKGHIALYVKKENLIIAGDALRVVDGELALPDKDLANNYTSALDSVRRLRKFDAEKIVCYHGGVYESEEMHAVLTELLESAGAIFKRDTTPKPIIEVNITATSPADGDKQVFGEGEFPETLNRMNYSAWFFDFLWSLAYSLPAWALLLFLVYITGYADEYLLGLTGMSAQMIPMAAILITILFQLVRIAFGFNANRLAWDARAKKLERLSEKAPFDRASATHLFRLRRKTVGGHLKTAENWTIIYGSFYFLNAVLTFFDLAPDPSQALPAFKLMLPTFAITPILVLIVMIIDRKRRGLL